MWPFITKKRGVRLGIDIGTSAVKIAALSPGTKEGRFSLTNYGAVLSRADFDSEQSSARLADPEIIEMVKAVLEEMKVNKHDRSAVVSIPVYTSFITEINLPKMPITELNTAISYQAKQYIPISISEVELDWQVLGGGGEAAKKEEQLNILLAAVPKEIVKRYEYIAKESGVKLEAMEIETFSLVRSAVGQKKEPLCLIDFGSRNTNITLVSEGYIRINRNIDVGGGDLTRVIAKSLGIELKRADEIKRIQGLVTQGGEKEITETLYPILDKILVEAERVINAFESRYEKKTEGIIIVGGSSQLPGTAKYFGEKLRLPIVPTNPWEKIDYPKELEPVLQNLAPSFATAIGLAMR